MSSIARCSPRLGSVSGPQEPAEAPGAGLDWNGLEVALAEAARVGEELRLERLEPHGLGRVVRGSVLRRLLLDPPYPLDARGVRLTGAVVVGELDLTSAIVRYPLVLRDCQICDGNGVLLDYATLSRIELLACRMSNLSAEGVAVTSVLRLSDSVIDQHVNLARAQVGMLNLSGVHLRGSDDHGVSLLADRLTVTGSMNATRLRSAGALRLYGARIGGQLACHRAEFYGTDQSGSSFDAAQLNVAAGMFLLDGFAARGGLRLTGLRSLAG